MSQRWYEHWLNKASRFERAGSNRAAIGALSKAEAHTHSPEELYYLVNWRNRLKRSEGLPTDPLPERPG